MDEDGEAATAWSNRQEQREDTEETHTPVRGMHGSGRHKNKLINCDMGWVDRQVESGRQTGLLVFLLKTAVIIELV